MKIPGEANSKILEQRPKGEPRTKARTAAGVPASAGPQQIFKFFQFSPSRPPAPLFRNTPHSPAKTIPQPARATAPHDRIARPPRQLHPPTRAVAQPFPYRVKAGNRVRFSSGDQVNSSKRPGGSGWISAGDNDCESRTVVHGGERSYLWHSVSGERVGLRERSRFFVFQCSDRSGRPTDQITNRQPKHSPSQSASCIPPRFCAPRGPY